MATVPEHAVARHRSLYQRLLWLYPASFRRDYGQAMVQVFCDRLRDEARRRPRSAAARAWLQTLGDLALSVPKQRIEVFMSEQETTARLVAVIVAVSLSIAAIALIGIPAVALLAAVPAWLAYQHRRGRLLRLPGQRKWYRWVLSGVAVLVVEWLAFMLSGEAGEWVWGLGGLLAVLGLLTVAVGVVMGVRDLRQHRGRMTPA